MKKFLHGLFDYNYHGNRTLIEQCQTLDAIPGEVSRLFDHILNAHHIWNHRLMGENPKIGVWDNHGLDAWSDLHYANQRDTFEIIERTADWEAWVSYENSSGRTFGNHVQDILFHIVNHGTHHRGQILKEFRAQGIEPRALDYIFYKR